MGSVPKLLHKRYKKTSLHHTWVGFLFVLLLITTITSCARNTHLTQEDASTANAPAEVVITSDRTDLTKDTVTITFACGGCRPEWHYGHVFSELVAKFEEKNPDIHIELVSTADTIDLDSPDSDHIWLSHQLMSQVDTASWHPSVESTQQGIFRDLSDLIDADASFDVNDFYPNMLEYSQWDGGTWAVPFRADIWLILYNQELFDEVGIPYPKSDWTWDEFVAISEQLTIRGEAQDTQYGFGFVNPYTHQLFIRGLSEGSDHQFTITLQNLDLLHPSGVIAAQVYADFIRSESNLASIAAMSDDYVENPFDLVNSGQTAMWLDRVSTVPLLGAAYSPISDTAIGVVSLPFGPDTTSFLSMERLVMSNGTQYPQESWRWLRFLTDQIIQDSRVFVPARSSVADQTGYWVRWNDVERATIEYSLEHARGFSEWSLKDYYETAATSILAGHSVEQALSDAQAAVDHEAAVRAAATPLPPIDKVTYENEQNSDATQISFATMTPYAEYYRQLSTIFNQSQSDIFVKVVQQESRTSADCYTSLKYEGSHQLSLEPLMHNDPDFTIEDISDAFISPFQYQGGIYGMPIHADYVQVIVYNRDLFDAAGVSYPQPGWTWEEFHDKAEALTVRSESEGDMYGYLALDGHKVDILPFLAMRGVTLWDEQGRPHFDAPEVQTTVKSYQDFALITHAMPVYPSDLPDPNVANQTQREQMIVTGHVAMWQDMLTFDVDPIPDDLNWGIAPWPTSDIDGVAYYLPVGISISQSTQHPEACWKWLSFVNAQTKNLVNNIPAQQSVLETPEYASLVSPERVLTYRAISEASPLSVAHSQAQDSQIYWFYTALHEILNGASVDVALSTAQQKADQIP